MGQKLRQGDIESVWKGRGIVCRRYIYIAEEFEARISCSCVKFVCAVLSSVRVLFTCINRSIPSLPGGLVLLHSGPVRVEPTSDRTYVP